MNRKSGTLKINLMYVVLTILGTRGKHRKVDVTMYSVTFQSENSIYILNV